MLDLIHHILRISPRRDRTEINEAMVDALVDLFHPRQLVIYRCYDNPSGVTLFACAGHGDEGNFLHNAYLPEKRYCRPATQDALHIACLRQHSPIMEQLPDGSQRTVFPVFRNDDPAYLIDLTLPDDLAPDQRVTMLGLIEYFANHIALLDYGETDTLTGLSNRKTFEKHFAEMLRRPFNDGPLPSHSRRRRREDSCLWLAVCDLDHFKNVNDNFGHLVGDGVLVGIAHAMRGSFRFDDQLFRFGGEEFIALLQPTTREDARLALERFRQNTAKHEFERVGQVTVSIGFTALNEDDTSVRAIDRADEALYYAKNHGRNQIACYETLRETGKLNY